MILLRSKKGIPLPKLYFVSDRLKIKDLPKGVPYIYGDEGTEDYIVRIMEYEVLYQRAKRSGYPFDFQKILREEGFVDMEDMGFTTSCPTVRFIPESEGEISLETLEEQPLLIESMRSFSDYIKDSSAYVDISVIKNLKIFPIWLDSIEDAATTNIQNFATYDNNMYNKKLEGMYGGISLKSPKKNLIIIDVSGSIPKAVSSTCLALAKNLSENFYADLLITGGMSTLYTYEEIGDLNIERIYEENGTANDQYYFKQLLSGSEREYDTVIVFGDEDNPGYPWARAKGDTYISQEDGKALCKWKVNKLLSFHTHSRTRTAGYADWFTPESTELISDWVEDLTTC